VIIRCSSLERRFNCPGSLAAEDGLPDKPSTVADSGTRIHNGLRLYFSGTVTDLADIAALCKLDEREAIILKWFAKHADDEIKNHSGALKCWPEFYMSETKDGVKGTADMVAHCQDNSFHCFDWKTGYARQITAESNLQLRAYCLKVAERFGCLEVTGHLYSAGDDPADAAFTSVLYGPDELAESRKEIYFIWQKCLSENAQRNPGKAQCQYCKACGNPERCPESIALLSKSNMPVITPELTPELAIKCPAIFEGIQAFETAARAFKSFIKDKLKENPDCIPGLTLKPGATRREITDSEAVFNLGLQSQWFSQDEFVKKVISISIGDLTSLLKSNLKLTQKAATELINTELIKINVLETKQNEPSVVLK